MRILLVKMSSLGDVFHTFPALTDAMNSIPDLKVDWIVEESFSEIAAWHPVVDKVYPIQLRNWRKSPVGSRKEISKFFENINRNDYDLVLDAQGLLKSAWVIQKIKAPSVGFSWSAAREPLASLFYKKKFFVDKNSHAIDRLRMLFSKTLQYDNKNLPLSYSLSTDAWETPDIVKNQLPYYVLLHGTTWTTKLWPEQSWVDLSIALLKQDKFVVLPWGTEEERLRSNRIKSEILKVLMHRSDSIIVPEKKLSLNEMARLLKFATGVVSVDTGLSHVAAALDVPMVVLYRVTDPMKVGALGKHVHHLISPIATYYVKKFNSKEQEIASLSGLSVSDVLDLIDRET